MVIKQGHAPGILGKIAERHTAYYSEWAGLGAAFETWLEDNLAAYVARLGNPKNALFHAEIEGVVVGSIAIDGEDLGDNRAHLRFFIVDDRRRGAGIGRKLIETALEFCDDQGFSETRLWTLKGLDAARHLYETNGFSMDDQYSRKPWDVELVEQVFVRPRPT